MKQTFQDVHHTKCSYSVHCLGKETPRQRHFGNQNLCCCSKAASLNKCIFKNNEYWNINSHIQFSSTAAPKRFISRADWWCTSATALKRTVLPILLSFKSTNQETGKSSLSLKPHFITKYKNNKVEDKPLNIKKSQVCRGRQVNARLRNNPLQQHQDGWKVPPVLFCSTASPQVLL